MKTLTVVILTVLCVCVPSLAQTPNDVYNIGKTIFGFDQSKNQTSVMSHGLTIFDNSSPDYSYVDGAQRLEMFLIHEYTGRTLKQSPESIQLTFESRSSVSHYKNPGSRSFELTVDGRTIVQAGLALDRSTQIGFITWENVSYDLSLAKANDLIAARDVRLTLGKLTHKLTAEEIAVFRDFLDSLRIGKTNWRDPELACSLLSDVGVGTRPYQYIGLNTFGCPSTAVPLPATSGNSVVFSAEGTKQEVTELSLVLLVRSNERVALASHSAFTVMCGALALRSLGLTLPDMLLLAVFTGKPFVWHIGSNTVEVTPSMQDISGHYELKFTIK